MTLWRSKSLVRVGALALTLMLLSASALGGPSKQDVAKADKLFKEARTLMGQGKFDVACPKLEESQSLDPAPGTKYQLAVCYEATSRPATALAYFTEIADLAKAAGYKDKEKVARDKAAALEPKVPRIVLEVPQSRRPSGLTILRDGQPVPAEQWNVPILVDPGEAVIEASAPGKKPFKTTVAVKGEGARVTVPIALQNAEDFSERDKLDVPPAKAPSSFGPMRIAGIGVGALGLGGVVVGSVFGFNAKSGYEKAMGDKALCPTKKTCYPEGKRLVDQAQSDALISTIGFVAGGVALAGGVVLIVAAPAPRSAAPATGATGTVSATVVPVVAEGFAGLSATGTF